MDSLNNETNKCEFSIKKMKIESKYFSAVKREVNIKFNDKIGFYDLKNWVEDPQLSFKLDNSTIEASSVKLKLGNTLVIALNLDKSIINGIFLIEKIENSKIEIVNLQKDKMFLDFPINTTISLHIDKNEKNLELASGTATSAVMIVSTSVVLTNPVTAIAIIKLLQSFDFLNYLNIEVPTVVLLVLQQLDFNIF